MSPTLIRNLKPLSAVDAAWLSMEDSTNLMMVSGILAFDEALDFERLKATLENGFASFDRFRQRVVTPKRRLGKPCWEFDPTFNIDNHLHKIALPEPGDQAALQNLASDLMSTPLDYSKPLWQFHLIENYGEGCALMCRLHHSIADGIALMFVLFSMADLEPDAPWPTPKTENEERKRRGMVSSLFKKVGRGRQTTRKVISQSWAAVSNRSRLFDLAKTGANVAAAAGKLALRPPDPKTIFKGKLGVQKRVAWSGPIALQDVKAIKQVTGATVNDVLLTAMTGALRRYLQDKGEEVDGLNFRAIVPVNLRPLDQVHKLGNQFGLVFLSLPVGIEDPLDRLVELKRRMDELKGSPEAVVAFGILNVVGMSIDEIKKIIVTLFGTKGTTVMTNVPGPRQVLYFAGKPIKNIMFWVPQSGRLGMGISILSYAGEVRLGVATDAGLVPDPETIANAFHSEFNGLMALVQQIEEDEAGNAVSPPPIEAKAVRCQAQTAAGHQCKNKALPESTFCKIHQKEGEAS